MTKIVGPDSSSLSPITAAETPSFRSDPELLSGENSLKLSFFVSRDEEHVEMLALYFGKESNLGERVHHYPLLLLVRIRAQEQRCGMPDDSAGWVTYHKLAKMLGMDSAHLYIQMFRLRRQLAEAFSLPQHPPAVIERRSGQLRAAAMSVRIVQGVTVQLEEFFGTVYVAD